MQTNIQANFNHVSPSIFAQLATMAQADGMDLEEYHEQILKQWILYPNKFIENLKNERTITPQQAQIPNLKQAIANSPNFVRAILAMPKIEMLTCDELIKTLFIKIDKDEFSIKLKIEIVKTHDNQYFARVFEENFYQLRPSFDNKISDKNHQADEQLFVPIDYWIDNDKYQSEQACIDNSLLKIQEKFCLL